MGRLLRGLCLVLAKVFSIKESKTPIMKKILLLFYLCSVTNISIAQDVLEKLQGAWLCDSITNGLGELSKGSYGEAGKYLEFHFRKKKVEIIKSPYDVLSRDVNVSILDTNYILIVPPMLTIKIKKGNRRVGGEFGYEVIDRGDGTMVLKTENSDGNSILYFLKRPQDLRKKSAADTVDMGYVLVRNSKDIVSGVIRQTAQTAPVSSLNHYYGIPKFYYGGKGFERFFGENIDISNPADFQKTDPDEYLVEFDVVKEGVRNIDVKGLDNSMKEQIFKAFTKSSERWKFEANIPADYKARLRFHFFIFLG